MGLNPPPLCAACGGTEEDFHSANIETFEVAGERYCAECVDAAVEAEAENNGQFGVGA